MNRTQKHKTHTAYNYGGVMIHAAPGVHESAQKILSGECIAGGTVLDLGCGAGAFTRRLVDHGFHPVPVDFDLSALDPNAGGREADLNQEFASHFSHHTYDAIVALEVIEHLENPQSFLRQIRQIANQHTVVIISFPNIHHYSSIRSFIRHGTFSNYTPFLYWETGHQSLLVDWLFEEHARKAGFTVAAKQYCGIFPFPRNPVKWVFNLFWFRIVCAFSNWAGPAARRHEVVMYTLRTSDNELGPTSQ